MAATTILEGVSDADVTTSSLTVWTDVASIPAASFTVGNTYLLYYCMDLRVASNSSIGHTRFVRGLTPTDMGESEGVWQQPTATTFGHSPSGMYVFTQPGTTELVKVQIKRFSGSSNSTSRFCRIIAVDLTPLAATDWEYDDETADHTTTTTMVARSSMTQAANGTDTWLLLADFRLRNVDTSAQGINVEIHSDLDGSLITCKRVGEGASDIMAHTIMRPVVLSNGTHTLSIRANHDAGISAAGTIFSTRLIALRLNEFQQFVGGYTAGDVSPAGGGTFTNLETESVTPTVTGTWAFFAGSVWDGSAASTSGFQRLQDDDDGSMGSDPAHGDDTPGLFCVDAAEEVPISYGNVRTMTSGASRTVNYDATEAAVELTVGSRSLTGLSAELASSAPKSLIYTPYRQLSNTYSR